MKEFSFVVNKDANTVIQYLTTIEKFVKVHPLIYKMKELENNKYKVFEKIKIGIFPIRFTYNAYITHDINSVRMFAKVMGMTTLSMDFSFSEINKITTVKEIFTVNSPLPIKKFMYKLIDNQHRTMFNNIEFI